jgi:molybdenum-dependent DNA-binding transcriptional regulator ModE
MMISLDSARVVIMDVARSNITSKRFNSTNSLPFRQRATILQNSLGARMLHSRLLNYIDEVARTGSIRKAADRLNVSASAISRQILALETQLGTPIFQRLPKKLNLTAAGEVLIGHVRQTLKELTRAQIKIEELKGLRRGEITVAMMSGLASNLVPSNGDAEVFAVSTLETIEGLHEGRISGSS